MKRLLSTILLLIVTLTTMANPLNKEQEMLIALDRPDLLEKEMFDTTLNHSNYKVRCIKDESGIKYIGIPLFNDNLKMSVDKEMLDYVEKGLLAKILGIEMKGISDFIFYKGEIADIKKVSPDTPCKISNINSRFLSFEWDLDSNKVLRLDTPISYEYAKRGSRKEIEEELINRIKTCDIQRPNNTKISADLLHQYKDKIYIHKGVQYLNENINRNRYFTVDTIPVLLKSTDYPAESIANLFIDPSTEDFIKTEIRVIKHEFGEIETFTTSLEHLLAVCEADGCIPYWGFENYTNKILSGSLFLYNWKHGYTHVLKVECNPDEILRDDGNMNIRASLFIPINNFQTLFEPSEN